MRKRTRQAPQTLSASLQPLLGDGPAHVTLGEILTGVEGEGGLGPALFLLTLPVLLPLPPGFSMVLSLPLLIVAPQIVMGRRSLWLPKALKRQSIKRADLVKLINRLMPTLKRGERMVRPRLAFLTSGPGVRLIGVACTLIALILVLPIPFANLAPATALGMFALGMTRKDGLAVLVGYALLALAAFVISLGFKGILLAIHHIQAAL
jgi:hypothetical protein